MENENLYTFENPEYRKDESAGILTGFKREGDQS